MTDIVSTSFVTVQDLYDKIALYKRNPSGIQRAIHDVLEEISGNRVNIVDPTNPFVFMMEASCVNTALAIDESVVGLTKQYSSLSQTENDLYYHMSDKEYIGRFASPSSGKFVVTLLLSDIMNKMTWDPEDNAYKATIPRDTRFIVEDYVFTMLYPIDIRKYENGVIQVTHDATIPSPIDDLVTNIIPTTVRRDPDLVDWIFFELDVRQFSIDSTTYPIQLGSVFKQAIPYTDQFYLGRAFIRNSKTNNQWKEIAVTHSDQVYDLRKPTLVFQVYEGAVQAYIPMIYITTELITGELRVDLYTTKGSLSVNLENYKPSSYSMNLQAIDEERDLNDFTATVGNISYYGYSEDYVTGGSDGIDFETLRDRVITNSNGPQLTPITPSQIKSFTEVRGFELVKNIDTVTNRIYLATQRLPKPKNPKLITSANIGISAFVTDVKYLKTLSTVADNGDRCTLLSKNLYLNDNGKISIVPPSDVETLKNMNKNALVDQVNSLSYLYTPYYYVLDDSNNEFSVRAYDLDNPKATNLSFVSQNETLQLPVNTDTYQFTKTDAGYRLTIITSSGNFYKDLDDGVVFTQLAYLPVGEKELAYINGTLAGKDDQNNRIWSFDIVTDYDLNSDDSLRITNAKMFSDETLKTWISLKRSFFIFHATTSVVQGYVPDAADALLGKFILPDGAVVSTMETIDLEAGYSLKALWSRSRSMPSGLTYQKHAHDVPMYYEEDVYEINPVNGSIVFFDANGDVVYRLQHHVGDPVLDNAGKQVYKYRGGDPVIDPVTGEPVIDEELSVKKEVDILFVDGRQYFADDPAFVDYGKELVSVIDSWIIDDLRQIQKTLLEKTYIYLYPKTMLGNVSVYTKDQGEDSVPSGQSFVVDLYVKSDIYNDSLIRSQLEINTVRLLDSYVSESVVNMKTISEALSVMYGTTVQSHRVSGLGGVNDYQIVSLPSEQNRLSLKKILVVQLDGSLIIKEDVRFNFYVIP